MLGLFTKHRINSPQEFDPANHPNSSGSPGKKLSLLKPSHIMKEKVLFWDKNVEFMLYQPHFAWANETFVEKSKT